MENFYKITKTQASLLGKIMYAENHQFDPFVGEQEDGNFLVSETLYKLLKHLPEFQKFDWSLVLKVDKDKLKIKKVKDINP